MTTYSRLLVGLLLLLVLGACDVGQVTSGDELDGVGAAATQSTARLRLVAANLTSSTGDYEAEGIRILQALRPAEALASSAIRPVGGIARVPVKTFRTSASPSWR